MTTEIKGYVRMEQREEFEAWEKEQESKRGPTPRELYDSIMPNPYGNGGGTETDFINITGNPEYRR